MYLCHDMCKTWVYDVVSFWSLRCSLFVGSTNVALRVDSDVSRLLFGRVLSPFCTLAYIFVAFGMYMWVRSSRVFRFLKSGVHSCTPSSRIGGPCA